MRSSHAAAMVGNILVSFALGTISQTSAAGAATRCPSGQILRVSLGVCVPKAENLAILSRHTVRSKRGDAPAEKADPDRAESEAATPDRRDGTPPVEVAQRQARPPEQKPAPEPAEAPSSPFGSLFVGAFRSAVTTGLSAFR
jgi:hypothetical protein